MLPALRRWLIPSCLLLFCILILTPAFAETTSLTMRSDLGDYIGFGQTYIHTPSTGTFRPSAQDYDMDGKVDYVSIYYNDATPGIWWTVTIATNNLPAPLTPGFYY